MRSRALGICCILFCCIMLYLASTAGRTSAQDRAVTAVKSDEVHAAQIESAVVEVDEPDVPIEIVPLPPGTVFEREVVYGEGVFAVAGTAEQLIYSNTLGTFGAALGINKLVADDITTTVPGGCALVRYEFPVVGKVNPSGVGGQYTVTFAMYRSCPQAVPSGSRPLLIIAGTQGQVTFVDQCQNNVDDPPVDGLVNDGCPAVGPAETGEQCDNVVDDDGDTKVNDGCPAVGDPEIDVGSTPRLISFVAPPNVQLETNMWFGVQFSRNNAGVVIGTPPLTGYSCDQYDYPGFPCDSNAGGFPEQPQASFNLEIFTDATCNNSYTGYKNDKPSGSLYNPGTNVFLSDDIQLNSSGCNMIAYEVAIRGGGFYNFRMRQNCGSGPLAIAGTERTWSQAINPDVKIARFTFSPPIPLPQNLSFQASVNNGTGSVVIAGQPACLGSTGDLVYTVGANSCTEVPPPTLGTGIHGAFNLAITCDGPAPVGACCDMYITDENNDSVCREVPEMNCLFKEPLPPITTGPKPYWVEAAPLCSDDGSPCATDADCAPNGVCSRCDPDQFADHPCGQAACCKPDGLCANLTFNECYAVEPVESPRTWNLGRYCATGGFSCPRIACLARVGECTLPRCAPNTGVCNSDRPCVGGLNPGAICTTNAHCRVCPNKTCTGSRVCTNKTCTGNRVCSTKQCSGTPSGVVCTGDGQGTCDPGRTCNFINCTDNTPCTPTGGTCPAAVTSCTGTGQGTCPPNQICNFINCSNDSPCLAGGGTCPVAVPVCTGEGQGTCPPNQTCSFTTCSADSTCTRVCSTKQCSGPGAPANTPCTGEGQGDCQAGQICNYITCTTNTPCTATGGTCQPLLGACPSGGFCGEAPNVCTAGLVDFACTDHNQCPSGECDLAAQICKCEFDSHCDCPNHISNPPPNGTDLCMVGPTCCDGCPPIGCEDPECCTIVCNQGALGVYCCEVEWDSFCAADARTLCEVRPSNDVCAPQGRLEGARLITDVPPSNATSDSGRATQDSEDPEFGCIINDPGALGLQTVWYKFYATYESALIQTCFSQNPATDSLIQVFAVGDPTDAQTACETLMPIACGDDFAGCSASGKNAKLCVQRLTPGNLYYVMVASKIDLADNIDYAYRVDISAPCTTPPPPPLGDFCADAPEVFDGTTAFTLADATMTAPVELCIPTMFYDKWYEYTATCSGVLTVETCGASAETSPDTNLAIYGSGEDGECLCPPTAGDPIDCSGDAANEIPSYPECGLGSKLEVDVVAGNCYSIRLADNVENRPSGNLTIGCAPVDCPAGNITFVDPDTLLPTDPPNGVVDAGRPYNPNNPTSLQGISTITAYGPRDALPSCFSLCETTDGGPLNSIAGIVEDPIGTYTITLTQAITAGELTTITYTDTNGVKSSGRFTSNPGNVNADSTSSAADVDEFFLVLDGTAALVWGRYSGDINRSYDPILNPGEFITPADGLEVVDLLNGAGTYNPWNGAPNESENPACPLP